MTRRESLKQRIKRAREAWGVYVSLEGCPAGGWAETAQARSQIADAIPIKAERTYTVSDLIDALYTVDDAGRYRWRFWTDREEADA